MVWSAANQDLIVCQVSVCEQVCRFQLVVWIVCGVVCAWCIRAKRIKVLSTVCLVVKNCNGFLDRCRLQNLGKSSISQISIARKACMSKRYSCSQEVPIYWEVAFVQPLICLETWWFAYISSRRLLLMWAGYQMFYLLGKTGWSLQSKLN